jgi:hypothetical protein
VVAQVAVVGGPLGGAGLVSGLPDGHPLGEADPSGFPIADHQMQPVIAAGDGHQHVRAGVLDCVGHQLEHHQPGGMHHLRQLPSPARVGEEHPG